MHASDQIICDSFQPPGSVAKAYQRPTAVAESRSLKVVFLVVFVVFLDMAKMLLCFSYFIFLGILD